MYGWRSRIGVIVSPPNSVVENEFSLMAPEGVSIHVARLRRPEGVEGRLNSNVIMDTNQDLPHAAKSLAELKLGVVVFAHTSGSMLGGPAYDAELVQTIGKAAGCPAVTTASAVVEALKLCRVVKLALVTPYPEEMTLKEVEFLEEAVPGLKVVSHRSLGVGRGSDLGDMEPTEAYRQSRIIDYSQVDALFLSGTNWRTVEVIQVIESDLGIPVITANQVSMWAALRVLSIEPSFDLVGDVSGGFGNLFNQQ